jgi:hypothetical protein
MIDNALLIGLLAFVAFLCIVEWWTITHHEPTISERMTNAGRNWPPVLPLIGFAVGWFFGHFWG